MHIGDLTRDEATDQDIARVPNSSGETKDLVPFGVAPPTAPDGCPYDGFGKGRDRSARAFEHDTVAADESEGASGRHLPGTLGAA